MTARLGLGLCAVVMVGCPPPEVLYGPEIFDETESAADVPALPGVPTGEVNPAVDLLRLGHPQSTHLGPTVEEVRALPHVEFSGTIVCQGCVEQLMLHVVVIGPNGEAPPLGWLAGGVGRTPLVSTAVTRGAFSIPVPQVDVPVAVELLVDANMDGVPSVGERYVRWLDPKAPLRTDGDRTGLTLDASDRPEGREDRARRGKATTAGAR